MLFFILTESAVLYIFFFVTVGRTFQVSVPARAALSPVPFPLSPSPLSARLLPAIAISFYAEYYDMRIYHFSLMMCEFIIFHDAEYNDMRINHKEKGFYRREHILVREHIQIRRHH